MDVLLFGRPSDYVVIQVFVNQTNDVFLVSMCVVAVVTIEATVLEKDVGSDTQPRTATHERITLASGVANCFAI
ncbi:MAG: hypothetical protein NZ808_04150 [Myxococcota bacterium]|jgi:hypothetical protein|nr:hypothetical protein [Myxococcota bacterium]